MKQHPQSRMKNRMEVRAVVRIIFVIYYWDWCWQVWGQLGSEDAEQNYWHYLDIVLGWAYSLLDAVQEGSNIRKTIAKVSLNIPCSYLSLQKIIIKKIKSNISSIYRYIDEILGHTDIKYNNSYHKQLHIHPQL